MTIATVANDQLAASIARPRFDVQSLEREARSIGFGREQSEAKKKCLGKKMLW